MQVISDNPRFQKLSPHESMFLETGLTKPEPEEHRGIFKEAII